MSTDPVHSIVPDARGAGGDAAHRARDPSDTTESWQLPLSKLFGEDGLTFGDVLDLINPLHHIPIVSTLYRSLTGDTISPASRIAGGGLFGGPIGLVAAVVNAAIAESSGKDVGEHVLALFDSDDTAPQPADTRLARTAAPPQRDQVALLDDGPYDPATDPWTLWQRHSGSAVTIPAAAAKPSPALASLPADAARPRAGAASGLEDAVSRPVSSGRRGSPRFEGVPVAHRIGSAHPVLFAPLPLPSASALGMAQRHSSDKDTAQPPHRRGLRAEDFTAKQLAERLRLYTLNRQPPIGPRGQLY